MRYAKWLKFAVIFCAKPFVFYLGILKTELFFLRKPQDFFVFAVFGDDCDQDYQTPIPHYEVF